MLNATAVPRPTPLPDPHEQFLELKPMIERYAYGSFGHLRCADTRADKLAECMGLAWQWLLSLHKRGKNPAEFPTVFSSLLSRAVRSGRTVAGIQPANDILSPRAQYRHRIRVEQLPDTTTRSMDRLYGDPHAQRDLNAFEERLVDNRRTPVADQVWFRLDFPAWLQTLTPRERRLIDAMQMNERTQDLARMFGVSAARISQLRREFEQDWKRFSDDSAIAN